MHEVMIFLRTCLQGQAKLTPGALWVCAKMGLFEEVSTRISSTATQFAWLLAVALLKRIIQSARCGSVTSHGALPSRLSA